MPKKKQDYSRLLFYGLACFAILLFVYLLLFSQMLRASIWITVFIALSMVLSNYKKFIRAPIEIEVLTLGIVICTIKFGIKAGLIVAILGGILSFIVGFNISPFSFPMLLGYITIAITSYLFGQIGITIVGIIASIINNAIVFAMYYFVFDYDLFKNLSFSISNLVFNMIIFFNIAPLLLRIIN